MPFIQKKKKKKKKEKKKKERKDQVVDISKESTISLDQFQFTPDLASFLFQVCLNSDLWNCLLNLSLF